MESFLLKTFFSISNDRRSGRLLIIAHSSSYGIMIGERRFPILSLIGYSPRPTATTPTEAELTIMKTMLVSGSKPPEGGVLGIKAGGCHWCGCCVAGWWRGAAGCRDDFMGQGACHANGSSRTPNLVMGGSPDMFTFVLRLSIAGYLIVTVTSHARHGASDQWQRKYKIVRKIYWSSLFSPEKKISPNTRKHCCGNRFLLMTSSCFNNVLGTQWNPKTFPRRSVKNIEWVS